MPRKQHITESFINEMWIRDAMDANHWSEDQFCRYDPRAKQIVSGFAKQSICEPDSEISVDFFPVNNLFGIPLNPDSGKVPVSDLMILGGFLGISGGMETVQSAIKFIKP